MSGKKMLAAIQGLVGGPHMRENGSSMAWHSGLGFQSYEEALVRACYNILLGREPEAEVSVAQKAPRIPEDQEQRFREVLRRFVQSEEFNASQGGFVSQPLLPLDQLIQGTRLQVEDKVRSLCRTTYLGDGVALCRILGRFHMFVHTSDVGFATHMLHRGVWEMWLTEFMVRTIKPGMRVLDVGGNFGYYSVLMSDLVGPAGHCHIFEPNQKIAELLGRTLAVNFADRYRIWEIALSDRDAEMANFFIPYTEPKNAQLVPCIDESLRTKGSFTEVPIRSMDSIADELGRIDFIKIDTEGAELDILAGMRAVALAQRPNIVVEVNCGRGYDAGPILREFEEIYGSINIIGGDGFSRKTSIEEVTTTHMDSDWLIHFTS